jgi:hypothetical protein
VKRQIFLLQKGEKTMFKKNEGILDRIVRVGLGLMLLPVGLFLLGGLQGSVFGLVVTGFGVWLLITGLTGVCPLYIPLGINTLEKEKELIDRCGSMAAGFRHGSDTSGQPGAEQICGLCGPSIGKPQNREV